MKKNIINTLKINLIAVIAAQIIACPVAYADNNIKIVNIEAAQKEIVQIENGKMMLKQNWNGMRFEVSSAKSIGTKKMKAVDAKEYENALNKVKVNLKEDYKVYFLNNKLSNYTNAMALSFTDNSVVVFGTYNNLSKIDIHRLAVHELGHQVAFTLMNEQKWNKYTQIRGLQDTQKYNNSTEVYNNRVQEIFAEDFRMICGGKDAQQTTHLNTTLENLKENEKLVEFFESLVK